MVYTNEEFEVLKRNELHLQSANDAWWVRNLDPEEAYALRDVDVTHGGGIVAFSKSCGTCVLAMCRRLAPGYFADKAEREQVESEAKKTTTRKKVKVEA